MKWALFLALAGCSAAPVNRACSDTAYLLLADSCANEAIKCRQAGGTEAECGTVCDQKADDWALRCGQ